MPSRTTKNSSNGRGGHGKSRTGKQGKRKMRGGSGSGRSKSSSPEASEREQQSAGREDSKSGLLKTAREHPIASAVTGVGAGLLLVEGARRAISSWTSSQNSNGNGMRDNREDEEGQEDEREQGRSMSRQSKGQMDESDESEDEENNEGIGEKLHEVGERVSKTTRQAISSLRSGASTLGHQAQSALEQGREIGTEFWEDHPLMIGAIALAAGVALGMLLPSTELEDRLMGSAADKVNNRLKQATGGVADRARRAFTAVVNEASSAVSREADREGLTPDRLGRKVSRLVSHVKQALTDAVETA